MPFLLNNAPKTSRAFCTENYHIESPIEKANFYRNLIVHVSEEITQLSGNRKHRLAFTVPESDFEVELSEESTLKELKIFLEERFENVSISFFSLDKIELAITTKWRNISSKKFYILIDKTIFIVNNISNREFEARQEMLQRTMSIGAPYYYSQVVSDVLYKFDLLNENSFGQRFQDGQKGENIIVDKEQVLRNLLNSLPSSKTKSHQDMDMLVNKHKVLEAQYSRLKQEYDVILNMSKNKAVRYMSVGLFIIGGHFTFVATGTYIIWSWDIVEPLAAFNSAAMGIILATTYFWTKGSFSNETFHEYLSQKILKRDCGRYGFDLEQYEKVKNDLNMAIRDIKKNILSDL